MPRQPEPCRSNEAKHAGFLEDLQREFPDIAMESFSDFNGLIARVNLHNRWHEGRYSASDRGVVIRRPFAQRVGAYEVEIVRNQSSALLAQAKLGRPDEKRVSRNASRASQSASGSSPRHSKTRPSIAVRGLFPVNVPFLYRPLHFVNCFHCRINDT